MALTSVISPHSPVTSRGTDGHRLRPRHWLCVPRHPAVHSTLPRDVDTNRGDRRRTHCPRIVAMFPSSPCAPTYGWCVVFVGLIAPHLIAVLAAGGPLETAPVTTSFREDAVVLDPPTPQLPRPVNVRMYRSPEVTSEVLQRCTPRGGGHVRRSISRRRLESVRTGRVQRRPLRPSGWCDWCAHPRVQAVTRVASAMP